jgi:hypothetical protein
MKLDRTRPIRHRHHTFPTAREAVDFLKRLVIAEVPYASPSVDHQTIWWDEYEDEESLLPAQTTPVDGVLLRTALLRSLPEDDAVLLRALAEYERSQAENGRALNASARRIPDVYEDSEAFAAMDQLVAGHDAIADRLDRIVRLLDAPVLGGRQIGTEQHVALLLRPWLAHMTQDPGPFAERVCAALGVTPGRAKDTVVQHMIYHREGLLGSQYRGDLAGHLCGLTLPG